MNHININQNLHIIEYLNTNILEYLYYIFSGQQTPVDSTEIMLDNTSELTGNVSVPGIYKYIYDWLTTKFVNLRINYSEQYLYIKDPYIKEKLLENNFGDSTGNYVTYAKAFAATSLPFFGVNGYNDYETNITEFTELGEFTNIKVLTNNFRRCKNLEIIDLKNITRLNNVTFYHSGIKHCLNSGNVEYINGQCFEQCENLETFDFSSVTFIGWQGIRGTKLTEIHFGGQQNISFESNAVTYNNLLTVIDGLENIVSFPNSNNIFAENHALLELRLDNCESILGNSFVSGCNNLETFYAPKLSGTINATMFSNCYKLKNLTIDWEHITEIRGSAFFKCNSLESVDLSNVTSFTDNNIFFQCSNLKNIGSLNSQVTKINTQMFRECSKLSSIDLSNITTLYDNCFYNCTDLASIGCDLSNVTNLYGGSHFYNTKITGAINLISVYNVTQIPESMFRKSLITSFTGSNIFTTTGINTFIDCTNLTSFICQNITEVKTQSFKNCSSLTTVNLPNLSIVGNSAFTNCTLLTSIGNCKPTSIDSYAFQKTAANVDLSECTTIGQQAFDTNTGIVNIDLSKVTSMNYGDNYGGSVQFQYATNLETVKYSNTLTYIPWYCFRGCTKLSSITNIGHVTKIGGETFRDCTLLTSIDLSSVEEIQNNAFYGCTALENIGNTSNLKMIGNTVFVNTKIHSINLENIETIASNNFSNLTSLNTPIIMKKIQSLGGTLFHGCPNIPYIVLDISTLPTKGNLSFGNQSNNTTWYVYITDSLYDEALSAWSSTEYNLNNRLKKLSTLPNS